MLQWDYLLPRKAFNNVMCSFWVVDLLRIRFKLTTTELSFLSYLYQITRKGASIVHSELVYNGFIRPDIQDSQKKTILRQLRDKGYLIRLRRDPSQPYLSRFISHHLVFVQLTPKGVAVIHDIEKEMYKLLLNTSLDDLTGVNKKGQTIA